MTPREFRKILNTRVKRPNLVEDNMVNMICPTCERVYLKMTHEEFSDKPQANKLQQLMLRKHICTK